MSNITVISENNKTIVDSTELVRVTNISSSTVSAGGGSSWGSITGTLSNQTDLQNELDTKTGDQTDSEIKTAYENNADTNAFTDSEKTNLSNQSGTNTGDQDLSGKQDTLVSGTNIKTINSSSLLGSGNIEISGESSSGSQYEIQYSDGAGGFSASSNLTTNASGDLSARYLITAISATTGIIRFGSDNTTFLFRNNGTNLRTYVNNNSLFELNTDGSVSFMDTSHLKFSSDGTSYGVKDFGFKRLSPNLGQITDGGTGFGGLALDSTSYFVDSTNNTQKMSFDLSGISPSTDIVIKAPNINVDLSYNFYAADKFQTVQYGTNGLVDSGYWMGPAGSGSTSAVSWKLTGSALSEIQSRLGLTIKSDVGLNFKNISGSANVGLNKESDGVLKVTDGGTGFGSLVVDTIQGETTTDILELKSNTLNWFGASGSQLLGVTKTSQSVDFTSSQFKGVFNFYSKVIDTSTATAGIIFDNSETTTKDIASFRSGGVEKAFIDANGSLSAKNILRERIIVRQASDFGTIDSTKEYFLDGVIDMGTTSIEIPSGGIYISGYNFNLSGLTSTENNYTLFTSPVGGSGDVLFMDFHIDVSGTTSQVYDIKSDTGFKAIEVDRINYNNCTSLGEIDNYRQGLETGTGRFGGTPELTLTGVWVGGYFIDTSIVRSLTDGAYNLFKSGTGFSMASRFRSNMNVDLPSLASYLDFSPSNFTNPSILQLENGIISRDGAFNANDANYTPNIQASDLASKWKGNNGLENTFEGGRLLVTSENLTTISAGSTWYDLNAIWTANRLEHFDSPSSGQLRHIGNSPREYRLTVNFIIEGQSNNDISIRLRKWDNSLSSFENFTGISRQINSLVGGRDVAIFNYVLNVNLDENDYVYFQVMNNSGNGNLTLEENSDWFLEER